MASAVAQPLFRPLPLDHPLRPSSADFVNRNHTGTPDQRGPSTLPPPLLFGRELSRPPSTSNTTMFNQPQYHNRSASLSVRRMEEYPSQQAPRPALPGLAELASLASSASVRSFSMGTMPSIDQPVQPIPTPTLSGLTNTPPVCQNCQTSTTPLWRRDEAGSVLCNACGLFLKLHGRPRPISLKTDVIKSRNRVKSANQGQKKKFDHGLPASQSEMATAQNGVTAHRRVSQMAASVASDRSHSPISRTHTPTGHDPNIAPQHLFDGVTLSDHAFQSPSLPSLHLSQPSPGSVPHDRHLDTSMSYEQLQAANTVLKTRVSELEVINMMYSDNETNLRNERDAAIRAQDELRKRVRELEEQLNGDHISKKPRLSDSPTSTLQ